MSLLIFSVIWPTIQHLLSVESENVIKSSEWVGTRWFYKFWTPKTEPHFLRIVNPRDLSLNELSPINFVPVLNSPAIIGWELSEKFKWLEDSENDPHISCYLLEIKKLTELKMVWIGHLYLCSKHKCQLQLDCCGIVTRRTPGIRFEAHEHHRSRCPSFPRCIGRKMPVQVNCHWHCHHRLLWPHLCFSSFHTCTT